MKDSKNYMKNFLKRGREKNNWQVKIEFTNQHYIPLVYGKVLPIQYQAFLQ